MFINALYNNFDKKYFSVSVINWGRASAFGF
jgi:hypothetical protein